MLQNFIFKSSVWGSMLFPQICCNLLGSQVTTPRSKVHEKFQTGAGGNLFDLLWLFYSGHIFFRWKLESQSGVFPHLLSSSAMYFRTKLPRISVLTQTSSSGTGPGPSQLPTLSDRTGRRASGCQEAAGEVGRPGQGSARSCSPGAATGA